MFSLFARLEKLSVLRSFVFQQEETRISHQNNQEEKKIKIGISIDRELYKKIKDENLKPSRVIEKLLREHYGN